MLRKILCLVFLLAGQNALAQNSNSFHPAYGKPLQASGGQVELLRTSAGWKISQSKCLATKTNSSSVCSEARDNHTYIDLINQLTDLERLAILPEPGEKCAQWSSYDRRSKYDAASEKYVNWSANGDGGGFIRKQEDGTFVFAEMQGPGVIWRIWSARATDGKVRIYLDGSETPAVSLPFEGYFNRENEPFTASALIHTAALGLNCYVPIPYQKSCKITAEGGWGAYYHFTYTTYPKGTSLPTFSQELSLAETFALSNANTILSSCGIDPAGKRDGEVTELKSITIAPGASETVAHLKGTRAITAFKVKMGLSESPKDYDMLRQLTLSINWDGESQPSVWSPLGDFFGTAPGANKYKSLPLGITDDGFYCYWYMPFEKSAVVKLSNEGEQERKVNFSITHAPVSHPISKLGRFHAKWHRDKYLPEDAERRAIDWTMLKTKGRGRYCGIMLHVWNPRGGWWGEGDEKFYIDGEKFPSTYGTGSEDYFGYAWCDPSIFTNCYHNQTFNSGYNRRHICVNRWHITDNVPFQKSFEAAIEKYYPNDKPTLYAAVAYWYQAAGQSDPYQPVPVAERIGYCVEPKVFKVQGALEGEDLEVVAKTRGATVQQAISRRSGQWSGDYQLWWIRAQLGDVLMLSVPVEKSGEYRLKMQLTKSHDYGIVRLHLDNRKLSDALDLYASRAVPSGELDMGVHKLEEGRHILRIEIIGANEKADKAYMFGLDYLLLEGLQ